MPSTPLPTDFKDCMTRPHLSEVAAVADRRDDGRVLGGLGAAEVREDLRCHDAMSRDAPYGVPCDAPYAMTCTIVPWRGERNAVSCPSPALFGARREARMKVDGHEIDIARFKKKAG